MYTVIEGVSYSGKSTQTGLFAIQNNDWYATSEPDGTTYGKEVGVRVREDDSITPYARYNMFNAARRHLFENKLDFLIQNELNVISDRSLISGIANMMAESKDPGKIHEHLLHQQDIVRATLPDKVVLLEITDDRDYEERYNATLKAGEQDVLEARGIEHQMQIQKHMIDICGTLQHQGVDIRVFSSSLDKDTLTQLISRFLTETVSF